MPLTLTRDGVAGAHVLSTCSSRRTCSMRRERKERPRPPRAGRSRDAPGGAPDTNQSLESDSPGGRRQPPRRPAPCPCIVNVRAMLSTARFPTRKPKRKRRAEDTSVGEFVHRTYDEPEQSEESGRVGACSALAFVTVQFADFIKQQLMKLQLTSGPPVIVGFSLITTGI